MELTLERSALPERPVSHDAATAFHLDVFGRWLRSAGAEGRLALVFLSGPAARRELLAGLDARGCQIVEATARIGAPVHPDLARHQGDHFNDKLFVVDGLEAPGADVLLREIGLQISTLRRMATWVAVLVESQSAHAALESAGGILRRHGQRRFVFLNPDDDRSSADVVPAASAERWAREHRIAERVHRLGAAAGVAPTALDFARLARTGYAALPGPTGAHSDLVELTALWRSPPRTQAEAAPWAARPSPAVAELLGRIAPALARQPPLDMSLAMALAADVPARYAARLPVAGSPLYSALAEVRAALDAECAPPGAALRLLRASSEDAPPGLRVHIALLLASAALADGALGACGDALAQAASLVSESGLEVAPELAFEVVEKQTGLFSAVGERGEARAGLDRLLDLLPRLLSPFYAARHALARGEQMMPLDPGKGREALLEAGVLFRTHGYDSWADVARQAAE